MASVERCPCEATAGFERWTLSPPTISLVSDPPTEPTQIHAPSGLLSSELGIAPTGASVNPTSLQPSASFAPHGACDGPDH
mmetsp:Transcript_42029/g.75190  ORF Transcript_42029/g.75190 Transcript_42029/m.75190 type:complete len:81 (-) Transcript_42029:569-811(-)